MKCSGAILVAQGDYAVLGVERDLLMVCRTLSAAQMWFCLMGAAELGLGAQIHICTGIKEQGERVRLSGATSDVDWRKRTTIHLLHGRK